MPLLAASAVLAESRWQALRRAHESRVRAWTDPHQERASRGEAHPVYDFLFDYYAFRPAWLRRWHPGPDVILEGESAREFLRWPAYRQQSEGVALDVSALTPGRRQFAAWLRPLLENVRARAPFFACHGLHEWAMVYRQPAQRTRHTGWPLRLAPEELARFLEAMPVRCTHFDAFRFFTPEARPLNRLQPARESASEFEQAGCLHANMDLYKWSFKLAPFAPAELIADCFELAREIREADMRASPYDLRTLGFEPIAVETQEGRTDYERLQRGFASRAAPLRNRLISLCDRLIP